MPHAHSCRGPRPQYTPAFSAAIAERIAGSRMVVLPNASHMLFLEQPDLINRHLLEFLQDV